jgi:uncharacterized protein (DUF1015 family)
VQGIQPFRALRYADESRLTHLTAPPYDAIEPGQVDVLMQMPHNITHLTLSPERRAAVTLEAWLDDGVLERDEEPAVFLETESFEHNGETRSREILHALVPMDPNDGAPPILFHEKTYAAVVTKQEAVLRATDTNLDSTLLLYEDEEGEVDAALAVMRGAPLLLAFDDASGRHHEVRRCTNADDIRSVAAALDGRPLLIADGHHRMESAMRHATGPGRGQDGARWRLAGLVHADSPGLALQPTHRVLAGDPVADLAAVRTVASSMGFPVLDIGRSEASSRLLADRAALVAVSSEDDDGAVLVSCRGGSRGAAMFVHERVLPALGDRVPDVTRSVDDAMALLRDQPGIAILQAAPKVDDVRVAADAGLPMPPKSTCFFPKLLSGLLLRPLDSDREA